jgi:hypothetical protein
MLVLIGVLLALIPLAAILYPFLRGSGEGFVPEDERSAYSELSRRWEAAVTGIKAAELERAIGNLDETDYGRLREQYMTEAATIMKAMDLEEQQEQDLLAGIEIEVSQVRRGVQGGDGAEDAETPLPDREPEDE